MTPVAPQNARRFFVDPYRSSLLYVLSDSHVFRSENGGTSWVIDTSLENQLTQGGAFPFKVGFDENPFEALLRDMQFDPHRPGTRFAAGPAWRVCDFQWCAMDPAAGSRSDGLTAQQYYLRLSFVPARGLCIDSQQRLVAGWTNSA